MSGPGQVVCARCGAISPPLERERDGRRWLERHARRRHGREAARLIPVVVDAQDPLVDALLDPRTWVE